MYSHWVETEFIGLKNGILDQSANILSKNHHLMIMDCKTNEHHLIKKGDDMPEFEVVVVYPGISKDLISTDFNNRVDECRVAGWLLQDVGNLEVTRLDEVRLRNIPVEVYKKYRDRLPDRFRKRADHFFTDQERVLKGAEYWAQGDLVKFGELIFQSGESSIYQYESGSPELITIYEILRNCEGVYGARGESSFFRRKTRGAKIRLCGSRFLHI